MFHGGEFFSCVCCGGVGVGWVGWQRATAFISSSDMVGSSPPPAQYSGKLRLLTPMEAKGRHPGSLCTGGRQGRQLHATGLETRPGEGQVTGASSPAALPSVLDLSPLCSQDPRALARGPEWLWLWMPGCAKNVRKLVNGRAAYNSHLLLPERKHKYKFLSQKIMAKDTFL